MARYQLSNSLQKRIDVGLSSFQSLLDDHIVLNSAFNNIQITGQGSNMVFAKLQRTTAETHKTLVDLKSDLTKVSKVMEDASKTLMEKIGINIPKWIKKPIMGITGFIFYFGYKAVSLAIYAARKTFDTMVGMGRNAYATNRGALGAGSSYGGFQSFNLSANYVASNPDVIINNVARGKFDLTSEEAMGFRALNITPTSDSADTAIAVIVAAAKWSKGINDSILDPMANAIGISSLLGGTDTLHALKNMPQKDIDKVVELYKQHKPDMNLTPQEANLWTVFINKLDVSGQIITTSLLHGLAALAKPISDLSSAFFNAVTSISNSKLGEKFFKWFQDTIKDFFSKGVDFTDNLPGVSDGILIFFKWFEKFTQKYHTSKDLILLILRGPTYGLEGPITNPLERFHKSRGVYFRSPREQGRIRAGAGLGVSYDAPQSSSEVVAHLVDARQAGLITNEQCVALATAAVGIPLGSGEEGGHTSDWIRGESVMSGNLVPGTPIATFLNRRGQIGDTYAIGGNGGEPGAHLDHAGDFQRYIRDDNGNIVGFVMSEQYAGSGGIHTRAYYSGGYGESNADNYSVIDVRSGGHLGGTRNPFTQKKKLIKDKTSSDGTLNSSYLDPSRIPRINNIAGHQLVWSAARPGILLT